MMLAARPRPERTLEAKLRELLSGMRWRKGGQDDDDGPVVHGAEEKVSTYLFLFFLASTRGMEWCE